MNKEIKKKWLTGLRSGKYRQGSGSLNNKNRFCCLGVLCDLAEQEGIVVSTTKTELYGRRAYGTYTDYLPDVVMKWAELDEYNPSVHPGITLSKLNDDNYDFQTIARVIEVAL